VVLRRIERSSIVRLRDAVIAATLAAIAVCCTAPGHGAAWPLLPPAPASIQAGDDQARGATASSSERMTVLVADAQAAPESGSPLGVIAIAAGAIVALAAAILAVALGGERRRRMEAEAALQRHKAQQQVLARLTQAALISEGLDPVLRGTAEEVARTLAVERSAILQLSSDGSHLEARAGAGWPGGVLAQLTLPADAPLGRALLLGQPVAAERLADHPALRGQGIVAAMGVAIRFEQRPWGAIVALAGSPRRFAEHERQFLEAAALTLAGAVARDEDRRVSGIHQVPLRAVWDHTVDGLAMLDEAGAIERLNPAAGRMFAHDEAALIGSGLDQLLAGPDRGAYDTRLSASRAAAAGPLAERPLEAHGLRSDGTTFPLELSLVEILLEGRRHFIATIRDLTDRRATEEQLRQAQKMEAVGELTGGVAHDFNNLLTVVLGNAEMLAEGLEDLPRMRVLAETTRDAAQRGAELTRRLLAFSRRQALQPVALDLNRLVLDVEKLLRRTLGEHIEIETVLHGGLWRVHVDPAQLEAALVNLALNARDAMGESGKLTIETANARLDDHYAAAHSEVTPGQYVVATVTDTGTGMPPEVRERAFEPFFTTKEVGKGTGLGLSMVYGFVKQSGGHVKIYSEEGQGTAVKIYLPRVLLAAAAPTATTMLERIPTGSETILVVEDDGPVREYVTIQLGELGYVVHEAEDGPAALRMLEDVERVDLLLTDVVMPGGMNGRQLAERAQALQPGLKVLYTSGYTEDAIIHHGRLDPGVQLLTKPFRKVELARKVRAVLDAPASS
jgi:PAS domain S-box-containing protein